MFARFLIFQLQGSLGQVKCCSSNGFGCILQAKAFEMLAQPTETCPEVFGGVTVITRCSQGQVISIKL